VSYETNRNAALAANMLVSAQLGIRSDNRSGDQRKDTFKQKLNQEKDALYERLLAPQRERAGKLEIDIAALSQEANDLKKVLDALWATPKPKSDGVPQVAVATPELSLAEKQAKSKTLLETINQKWTKVRQLQKERAPLGSTTTREDIEITAQAAANTRRGNCDEMSSIAFLWLATTSIRPIDLLETHVNSQGDQHQFVVIGRPGTADLNDPEGWTRDAVVCDPWLNEAFPAADLPDRLIQIGYPDLWGLRAREE
jgi:hypothetical protein